MPAAPKQQPPPFSSQIIHLYRPAVNATLRPVIHAHLRSHPYEEGLRALLHFCEEAEERVYEAAEAVNGLPQPPTDSEVTNSDRDAITYDYEHPDRNSPLGGDYSPRALQQRAMYQQPEGQGSGRGPDRYEEDYERERNEGRYGGDVDDQAAEDAEYAEEERGEAPVMQRRLTVEELHKHERALEEREGAGSGEMSADADWPERQGKKRKRAHSGVVVCLKLLVARWQMPLGRRRRQRLRRRGRSTPQSRTRSCSACSTSCNA